MTLRRLPDCFNKNGTYLNTDKIKSVEVLEHSEYGKFTVEIICTEGTIYESVFTADEAQCKQWLAETICALT